MKTYTVGFIFNPELTRVLLMHKNRPDWQNGKMNGPGGRIEEGEESIACIVREIQEETGLTTKLDQWTFLGTIHEPATSIDFYATIHEGLLGDASMQTDELVEWCLVASLPTNTLSNVPWLVAYAHDRLQNIRKHTFVVRYE